jgi:hypothetical protein
LTRSKATARTSFYFWMAIALALTAFIGFSRSYFLQHWTSAPPLPLVVHVHGLLGSAFMLLFVAQTALIARGRTDLHRRLGVGGLIIAVLFFLSAFPAGIAMAHVRGETHEAIVRLALPFVAAPVFIVLIAAAVVFRRRPEVHKRLMLFAAIDAVIPAIGRLPLLDAYAPLSFLAIIILFLLAVVVRDLWRGWHLSAATVFGGSLVLVSLPGRVMLGASDTWQGIARELVALF